MNSREDVHKELSTGEIRDISLRASLQFDYFLIGGSGAMLAFSIQTFRRSPASSFAVIGWISLLSCIGIAVAHIYLLLRNLQLGVHQRALMQNVSALLSLAENGEGVVDVVYPSLHFATTVEDAITDLRVSRERLLWTARAQNSIGDLSFYLHLMSISAAAAGLAFLGTWKFCDIFGYAPIWY